MRFPHLLLLHLLMIFSLPVWVITGFFAYKQDSLLINRLTIILHDLAENNWFGEREREREREGEREREREREREERESGRGGYFLRKPFGNQTSNAESYIIECVFSKVQVIGCCLLIRQESL